ISARTISKRYLSTACCISTTRLRSAISPTCLCPATSSRPASSPPPRPTKSWFFGRL
ncbi:hypothetical protein NL676_015904, partial [Syzygium grande]